MYKFPEKQEESNFGDIGKNSFDPLGSQSAVGGEWEWRCQLCGELTPSPVHHQETKHRSYRSY